MSAVFENLNHLSVIVKDRKPELVIESNASRFLNKMSLGAKLLLAPMVGVLFLISLVTLAYFGMNSQRNALNTYQMRFQHYQHSSEIFRIIQKNYAEMYKLLSWANINYNKTEMETLSKIIKSDINSLGNKLNEFILLKGLKTEETALLQKSVKLFTDYKTTSETAVNFANEDPVLATTYMRVVEKSFSALEVQLSTLMRLEDQLSKEAKIEAVNTSDRAILIMIVNGVLSVILAIFISLLIKGYILRPFQEVSEVADNIANGDLTKKLTAESDDEIGIISNGINQSTKKLQSVIRVLSENAIHVEQAASELSGVAHVISDGNEKIVAQTEEVATASEELSASSSNIAARCDQSVNETSAKLDKIIIKINEAGEKVNKLSSGSKEIKNILTTISLIAQQTHILALNAAVEAARAGEHGRGFSVVAKEIKMLSDSTKNATKEVKEIIEAMQEQIDGVVTCMVKQDSKKANLLTDIEESIGFVAREMKDIASSAQEEKRVSASIANAIQEVSGIIIRTSHVAAEMAQSMESLKDSASQLKGIVNQFKY